MATQVLELRWIGLILGLIRFKFLCSRHILNLFLLKLRQLTELFSMSYDIGRSTVESIIFKGRNLTFSEGT